MEFQELNIRVFRNNSECRNSQCYFEVVKGHQIVISPWQIFYMIARTNFV